MIANPDRVLCNKEIIEYGKGVYVHGKENG